MSVSSYDGRSYDPSHLLRTLCWMNVLFAVVVIFAWSFIGYWLADPISAAAGSSVTAYSRPELLEYPYLVMWMLPVAGTVAAAIADRVGMPVFAKFVAAYPLMLMALSFGWFHWLMYL